MVRYRLVATDSFGKFRFAATLWCADDAAALRRFAELPLDGCQAWLSRRQVRLAFRAAEAPRNTRRGRAEARPAAVLGKVAGASGEHSG